MMKKSSVIFFVVFFVAGGFVSAAQAETVPTEALDKDFIACMGAETVQTDPQRGEYCNCIRDTMKNWSLQSYEQVAQEGAKAHDAGQEPPKLQEIAKACITKVLGTPPQ